MKSTRNPLAQDLDHVLEHTELLWEAVRGERFFLTGGTGFVGSWLTESLLWANRRLNLGISACLLTRNPNGFIARSPHLACDPAAVLLTGDAMTFDFPAGPFSFVVHAATERYVASPSCRGVRPKPSTPQYRGDAPGARFHAGFARVAPCCSLAPGRCTGSSRRIFRTCGKISAALRAPWTRTPRMGRASASPSFCARHTRGCTDSRR